MEKSDGGLSSSKFLAGRGGGVHGKDYYWGQLSARCPVRDIVHRHIHICPRAFVEGGSISRLGAYRPKSRLYHLCLNSEIWKGTSCRVPCP